MSQVARLRLSPSFRLALISGAIESVRIHLRSGDNVNVRDERGRTPLILAATRGHDEICRLLLQEGACLHARDQFGNDAASTAHAQGHGQIERLIQSWSHVTAGDGRVAAGGIQPEAASLESDEEDVAPVEMQPANASHSAAEICNAEPAAAAPIALETLRPDSTAELDLSGWEEEVETPPPLHDPNISANSVALHRLVTRHVVIDTDEEWDEVEVDLPDPADTRRKGIRFEPDQRENIRLVIVEALRDGRISESRLLQFQACHLDEGQEPNDLHKALRLVCGDLGVVVDDTDAPDPLTVPDESEDEVYGDAAYGAVSYLSRHLAVGDDHYYRFLANAPKAHLSRKEEAALVEKRDQGRLEATRALASCEAVVTKLQKDLENVLAGMLTLRVLIDVDNAEKDDVADGDAAEEDSFSGDPRLAENFEIVRTLADACTRSARDPEYLAQCLRTAGLQDKYFRELCHVSPPGSESRDRIMAGLQAAEAAEMQLVAQNLRLVAHFANSWGRGLTRMERLQEGTFGLIRAARKFSSTRGTKFATYAVWWIRQAIHRAAADTVRIIRVPVHVQEAVKKVDRAVKALEERGISPTVNQIAIESGIPLGRVARLLVPTPEPISSNEVEGEVLELVDPASGSEEVCNENDLRRGVVGLLSTLDPRSERILRLRFGINCDEHTLEEIGQMYDVTRERIRQIEAKALRKLEHPSRSRHLRGAY